MNLITLIIYRYPCDAPMTDEEIAHEGEIDSVYVNKESGLIV